MAKIPLPEHSTIRAIDQAVEDNADRKFRSHLGASSIGRPCDRELYYSFRWVFNVKHSGRILRLFARGQREEDVFVDLLRQAGMEVHEKDDRGRQFRFSAVEGHFAGSVDGVVKGVPEAPDKWHVLECKTANDSSFKDMVKKKLEVSKPEHYAQVQCYMLGLDIDRCLYLMVNKNTDEIYQERVELKKRRAKSFVDRAQLVVYASTLPDRISDDPSWYQCKFCDYTTVCHSDETPAKNCRTCEHASPSDDKSWQCAKWDDTIPHETLFTGCEAYQLKEILK